MFTGIIEAVGHIESLKQADESLLLQINTGKLDLSDVHQGNSIAVNGVCLTAVRVLSSGFVADVSRETLAKTSFAILKQGSAVNLEKAMVANGRFGGHMVSGHVDGIGEVTERRNRDRFVEFGIKPPKDLLKYIAAKGSICVDGVSLTVNTIKDSVFSLTIVPHTLQETIIGDYQVGRKVNLEVDLVARYLERLMRIDDGSPEIINKDLLTRSGFTK